MWADAGPTSDSTSNRVRVLIVDDHRVLADGLALAVSRDPKLEVVGVGSTAAEGLKLARAEQPDVVLLDFHLPDGTGAGVAQALRRDCPNAAVIILTADETEDSLAAAVKAGVAGFLLKSLASQQVIGAVHRAAAGEMLIPAATLAALLGRDWGNRRAETAPAPIDALTARESEVLMLMSEGLDNRAIAERLVVSYVTVRSHVQRILDKLDAHSKLEAVVRANELGLIRR